MVPFTIIGTGSTGNAVIVGKNILIDCGLPYVKIEPYMGDLKLVLLTHEHTDHFKPSTVRRMALEKPLLRFGCGPWMVKRLVDAGVAKGQIDIMVNRMAYPYSIGTVIPFPVFHDVDNYGYKLHLPAGKVFYATDLGNTAGLSARGYDLIMLEANYGEEEIKVRMDEKRARGEFVYEQRSLRYHLSEEQCNDFIIRNAGPTTEYVYLHKHVDRESFYEGKDN